jgi:integrase/recombinase XerC
MASVLYISEFLTYIRYEKRFSSHTELAYSKDLENFFEFSKIKNVEELSKISTKYIRTWMVHLVSIGLSNKSVNRKLSSLKSYFKFLNKHNIISTNPAISLNGPKIEKRLPQFAKESDLDKIKPIEICNLRDALIIEILYQTGIRLSELLELKIENLYDDKIKVRGKRNKERIVPISNTLKEMILKYRSECKENGFTSNFLILTDKGNKLYQKFVYRKVRSYLSAATDLQKRSPHVLRHTFATHMLNNNAGIETIKSLLGHASLAATQVYTHNSFAKLNSIYSSAHPRGHK